MSYYKKLYGNHKTEEEIDLANTISIPSIIEAEVEKSNRYWGKGVRQGDPLSQILFSVVLESVFRRLNWEELGINVDGTLPTHLRFADNIMSFTKTPEDIKRMIEDLAIGSEGDRSKT
ncbi:Retrovirus-related Pol polyprotein from type-1 retrotransposable element R2 [Eumeta japonica]|uniref:Retrovirus-related Pol polyprotein from type-1 retrotransposable element R2 n=1 Tax=Eumeta variegata TaxID=151549 RepID=A0A4C1X147_EUMVA|nr:Retrovirus-related Pol polyprotein from type-1 retrotransposable element R2 [Eumeta japonica]